MKSRKVLRFFVLIIIIASVVIALYHILLGSPTYRPNPTEFTPWVWEKDSGFLEDLQVPQGRLEEETDNDVESPARGRAILPSLTASKIPRIRSGMINGNISAKYAGDRNAGKCLKIQSFKPDIDALDVYPNLEFDAEWIKGKEYWNNFFEKRYKSLTDSTLAEDIPSLKVIVIPHSHNDPGWLKTYEQYYQQQTKYIIDNAVEKLTEFKNMSFLWSEISFLSKWWEDSHPRKRAMLTSLVKEGRIEIVTGGWVMTDEATVNLYSMIDQLIEGQQWVKKHLKVVPKSSWSVDPFGHGSAFPYILKRSGITGMVIQRIHYAWKKWLSEQQKSDFEWVQRWDFGKKKSILCHNAPFDIYSIKHSCGPRPHLCLNFDFKNIPGEYAENTHIFQPITRDNVKERSELMLEQYGRTASLFSHNVAMISMGDDFRFTKPIEWDQQYFNYMKLFHYINENKERYKADVRFGTVSDYFTAVRERESKFPTFSGDFHVYSDIFSEGRPAYWSGYYGTRPFWKKFYRETENNLRGAEILFTMVNAIAPGVNKGSAAQILTTAYEELTIARRWLALFAHHDASTGTSKADTMMDYGFKLLEAFHLSSKIQITAIETLLFGKSGGPSHLSTTYDIQNFGALPREIPMDFEEVDATKRVILYNNLGRSRYHLAKVVVSSPLVRVVGPSGEHVQAQLNPVLDTKDQELSNDVFELTFLANLAPLSLSVYEIRKASASDSNIATRSIVYCKDCKDSKGIFEVNKIQSGDIQLNNERLQVLFDRNTGLIMRISKTKDEVSADVEMKFGSYSSISFRSGAYLLMPDTQSEQEVPYPESDSKVLIISGPISSEISVFHAPILLSSRIMHAGDKNMLEAVFIQNQIDVKDSNGEVYMRFDTDLKSTSKASIPKQRSDTVTGDKLGSRFTKSLPTFYTDQSGFTVEKRVKIPSIRYEGNNYPVNTMAYIQDESRKLRFSVLVDRSHGFSSMETGRLETLVERRTVYDDSRGMGEGVTDNVPTISNYILLLETIGTNDKFRHMENSYRNSLPTLTSYHLSQELSYPGFLYVSDGVTKDIKKKEGEIDVFPLLNQELPCDSHIINLRTMADPHFGEDNFPGRKALLITQKLGYLCNDPEEKPGCGNPNPLSLFYPDTKFNGIRLRSITQTDLAGVTVQSSHTGSAKSNLTFLHEILSEPFEINTVVLNFK